MKTKRVSLCRVFLLGMILMVSATILFAQEREHASISKIANMAQIERPTSSISPAASEVKKAMSYGSIIDQQPQGQSRFYTIQGQGWYKYIFWTIDEEYAARAGQMVFDGQDVYIRDIVNSLDYGTWVKGSLSQDGKEITIPVDQWLFYDNAYQQGGILCAINQKDSNSDPVIDEERTQIKLLVQDDGTIVSEADNSADGYAIGAQWEGEWISEGSYNLVYSEYGESLPVLPDDIEACAERYAITYLDNYFTESGKFVNVAFVDDYVYVNNLFEGASNDWIKGKIEGEKVIFEADQFLGIFSNYFIYFVPAELQYSAQDDTYYLICQQQIELEFDSATKTISGTGVLLAMTGKLGSTDCYFVDLFIDPSIYEYEEKLSRPADPVISNLVYYQELQYGYISTSIAPFDTEGNFLNPENLYYSLYTDNDQLFVFTPDCYDYLDQSISEIPYLYTDNWDIYERGQFIYFYELDFDRIGIQAIYKSGGQEARSHIVYYGVSAQDEIQIDTVRHPIDTSYIDIMGRKVEAPANGWFIQVVTYDDGTVETAKVILK